MAAGAQIGRGEGCGLFRGPVDQLQPEGRERPRPGMARQDPGQRADGRIGDHQLVDIADDDPVVIKPEPLRQMVEQPPAQRVEARIGDVGNGQHIRPRRHVAHHLGTAMGDHGQRGPAEETAIVAGPDPQEGFIVADHGQDRDAGGRAVAHGTDCAAGGVKRG